MPAARPTLELADVIRASGDAYRAAHRLSGQQHRVLSALADCRTAALGGFKAQCDHCDAVTIQYASCRNRHCPKCQTLAQSRWVERQCAQLLDIGYFHLVFTLPHELNTLAQGNPALIYRLLFKAVSETLLEFGRNPRWLGGEVGITMVLHTWGQTLGQHIHLHCIVTGGALSVDEQRWIPARKGFLFPRTALSTVFRGKYLDALTQAYRGGELRMPGDEDCDDSDAFDCLIARLRAHRWVVYAKAPFHNAAKVLAYLGRYTHRVAIANNRLVSFDGQYVHFRWRDYAHGNNTKIMRLDADEFVRRFLLHTLPRGFTRIRHYGVLANRCRAHKLARCRELIGQPAPAPCEAETAAAVILRVTGIDISRCRHCRIGTLHRTLAVLPQPPRHRGSAPARPP